MTINKNLFAPQKFQILVDRFPNVEFWAKSVEIPMVSLSPVKINTGASVDFYQVGDKLEFETFTIDFFLDEDLKTLEEIYVWIVDCVKSVQPKFKPYGNITAMFLTNNQNPNRSITYHNAFPFEISPFMVDARSSEDDPITMQVKFKYSHFSLNGVEINI